MASFMKLEEWFHVDYSLMVPNPILARVDFEITLVRCPSSVMNIL